MDLLFAAAITCNAARGIFLHVEHNDTWKVDAIYAKINRNLALISALQEVVYEMLRCKNMCGC